MSLPGTPTYNLAKFLWKRLRPLIQGSQHSISNSQQFLDKLKNIKLEGDELMVSFDVTALFTSIDLDVARTTLKELLSTEEHNFGTLKKDSLCKLVQLCQITNFKFDGSIYEQLKGTPMGSPISGFIAESVMQKLENTVLPTFFHKIWVRYVDDIFTIVKKGEVENIQALLNNSIPGIKFTSELETDNKLPFLDVLVQRTADGTLETSVFRKSTHTDQILNYRSNHPAIHKQACIRTLFGRIKTHCSTTELRRQEEKHLFKVFTRNGYPRNFIRRTVTRLSKNGTVRSQSPTNNNDQRVQTRRIMMPYIKQISEMTARLLRPHGVTIAHKPMGTLRQIVSKPKPINKLEGKNNVIYQIQCNDCSAKYVGQTGRKLATRLHEHQLAIKRHDRLSLISVHEDNEGHHFNFKTVKILDRANNKRTREFLEAWHSTENSINKHVELDRTYFPLRMNDLKKSSKKRNPSSRRSQPAGERQ